MYYLFIWVGIYNCLDKHYHGHESDHEIDFGTLPEIIQLMHYKLWDPVYYYGTEETFPITKERCGRWFGPKQYFGDDLTY